MRDDGAMSSDSLLTTRDAARRLGVGPSTIKRWADEGVLECVRTAGGHRRFPVEHVEALLQNHRSPPRDFVDHWIDLLTEDVDEYLVLSELYGLRAREGAWYHVCDRLGPVLSEIGDRWQSGTLTAAREHTASERLQRAIIKAVETLSVAPDMPGALLCLPDGEEHSFGLYFAELVCREAGWFPRTLSRPLPDAELVALARETDSRVVVLSASSRSDQQRLTTLVDRLVPTLLERRIQLIVGGKGPWPEGRPRTVRLQQFSAFRAHLDAIA